MLKKLLCCVFAAAMIISAAASCGKTKPSVILENETAPSEENDTATETSIIDILPSDKDFNGYELRIAALDELEHNYGAYLMPEMENGELLNDTAFRRNREIEERYNVKLSLVLLSSGDEWTIVPRILSSVMSGSDDYQYVQFGSAWDNPVSLIQGGALMNLLEIPELNISSPGFYNDFNKELEINGKLYFAFSQYANAGTLPIYMGFNKNMIFDFGLEQPYDLIFSGGWTWDVFLSYIAGTYADLDGNGKRDITDRYGFANGDMLSNYMVWGFDISIMDRAEDRGYVPDILNDKFVSASQIFIDFKKNNENAYIPTSGGVKVNDIHMFNTGNVMFSHTGSSLDIRTVDDFDVGIAPLPKYDEKQANYCNYMYLNQFGVPSTVLDPDIVGAVAEGLAVLSKAEMAPAYIDVYVQEKLLRDEESKRVALLLMEESVIDVTRYYDFADGSITPVDLLSNVKDSGSVVSSFTKVQDKAVKKAEEFFSVFYG
ncbi:MAG: hypothetical protein K6D94_10625 [Clostridiales bacterium]|nr:hypothetical protein [Clostridiales bacterium]